MSADVLVVVGVGGMGESIARRLGAGKQVLLADFSDEALERVAALLRGEGIAVSTQKVDVSSRAWSPLSRMLRPSSVTCARSPTRQVSPGTGRRPRRSSGSTWPASPTASRNSPASSRPAEPAS